MITVELVPMIRRLVVVCISLISIPPFQMLERRPTSEFLLDRICSMIILNLCCPLFEIIRQFCVIPSISSTNIQTYQALKAYGSSPSPNFLAPKLEPTGGPFFLCHLSYAVNTFGGLEGPASGTLVDVSMVVVILLAMLVVLFAMHHFIMLLSIYDGILYYKNEPISW